MRKGRAFSVSQSMELKCTVTLCWKDVGCAQTAESHVQLARIIDESVYLSSYTEAEISLWSGERVWWWQSVPGCLSLLPSDKIPNETWPPSHSPAELPCPHSPGLAGHQQGSRAGPHNQHFHLCLFFLTEAPQTWRGAGRDSAAGKLCTDKVRMSLHGAPEPSTAGEWALLPHSTHRQAGTCPKSSLSAREVTWSLKQARVVSWK